MSKRHSMVWIGLVAALVLMFQPAARADLSPYFGGPTVTMHHNGGLAGDDGHYFLSPYSVNVNNVAKALICNDAFDDISAGDTWTAQVLHGRDANFDTNIVQTDFSLDTGVSDHATLLHMWDMDAYLKIQLFRAYGAGNKSDLTLYSYALWELFDSGFHPDWAPAGVEAAQTAASSAAYAAALNGTPLRRNLIVYDPITYVGGGTGEAQVFDTVPDGGLTVMLLGGALVGLESLRRRFRA